MSQDLTLYEHFCKKIIAEKNDREQLPIKILNIVSTITSLPSNDPRRGGLVFRLMFDTCQMLWRYNKFFDKHPFHLDEHVENFRAAIQQVRHFNFQNYDSDVVQYIANFPANLEHLTGLKSTYHYVRQARVDEHFGSHQQQYFKHFFDRIRTRFNNMYDELATRQGENAWREYNATLKKPFAKFDLSFTLDDVITKHNAEIERSSEFERMFNTRSHTHFDDPPYDDLSDLRVEPLKEGEDAVVWMWHQTDIFSGDAYYDPANHIPEIKRFWNNFHKHHQVYITQKLLNPKSNTDPLAVAKILPDVAYWMVDGKELKALCQTHITPLLEQPLINKKLLQRSWKADILTTQQKQELSNFAYDLYTRENSGAPNLVRRCENLRCWLFFHYRINPTLSLWEFYFTELSEKYSISDEIFETFHHPLADEVLQSLLHTVGIQILGFYLGDRSKHSVIKTVILSSLDVFKKMLDAAEKEALDEITDDKTLVTALQNKNHPLTRSWSQFQAIFDQKKKGDHPLKSSPELQQAQKKLRSKTPDGVPRPE